MTRPRDRKSAAGLLPRMEARPGKKGTTYRYHPVGGKPISLGQDLEAAIRQVLDLNGDNRDHGTLNELWRIYADTKAPHWCELSQATRDDYTQSSKQLLPIFGAMAPKQVKPAHIARYLRVERGTAPVRANREFALLSNLMNLAVERGELDTNPCKQVRRNKERPRKNAPAEALLSTFLAWAWSQKGQSPILAGMAEFASIAGNRGVEFRELTWTQVGGTELRIMRAKQRAGHEVVEVIPMSPMLEDLIGRMRRLAKDDRHGWVFPNADGNAYTAQAFKLGFARLKTAARKAGKLETNFTFHDLRSYYVTTYKAKFGSLPEIHADPGTTARIYDSSKTVNRKTL
jgi:site-specific recombinase XerD